MGYYKIPQDVEAEDKLIGPFTFKQFLFLIGFFISGFLMVTIGAQSIIIGALFLPFVLFFGLLGFYRPKDQPVENKILAYLNYYFRPHTRMWSRDGIIEHVIIKVPKKERKYYGDERTPDQVRSQLKQLAQVVDTRGWSTKQTQIQTPGGQQAFDSSDRIYNPVAAAPLQDTDVHAQEDMFDEHTNPVAENFDRLSQESAERSRQEAIAHMHDPQPGAPTPHISHVSGRPTPQTTPEVPEEPSQRTPTQSQPAAAAERPRTGGQDGSLRYDPYPRMHQKVIDPYGNEQQPQTPEPEVPEELRQMAQSDMNVSAIERHSKEYQEQATEGEISIEH